MRYFVSSGTNPIKTSRHNVPNGIIASSVTWWESEDDANQQAAAILRANPSYSVIVGVVNTADSVKLAPPPIVRENVIPAPFSKTV